MNKKFYNSFKPLILISLLNVFSLALTLIIDGRVFLQVVNKKLNLDEGSVTPHVVASIFEQLIDDA